MANWGLLMGVGQGLQSAAGLYADQGKMQLADKLQQEKEVRDQARKDKEYERSQLEFSETRPELVDGVWMDVDYAKNGHRLDSRIAPPDRQQTLSLAQQKQQLDFTKSQLDTDLAKFKLEDAKVSAPLERQLLQSQADYYSNRGLQAAATADKTGTTTKRLPTASEVSEAVIKQNQKVIDDLEISPSVAKLIADRVAANLIQQAQNGQVKDPSAVFLDALRRIKQGTGVSGTRTPSYGKETL